MEESLCKVNLYTFSPLDSPSGVEMEVTGTRFKDRLTWLVDNRRDLKMMMQSGDLMNFNDVTQYAHQSDGLKVLDDAGIPVAGRIDIVWDSQIDIVAILLDCHALIGFQVRYHRSFGA